jgi:hypothetical protein
LTRYNLNNKYKNVQNVIMVLHTKIILIVKHVIIQNSNTKNMIINLENANAAILHL